MENKVCVKCDAVKNISEFYYNYFNNHYYSNCKTCHKKMRSESIGEYHKTEAGKKALLKASNRAREKYPEKWEARATLRYEVKKGNIVKPIHCEKCDEIKPLQGHHDDYKKPLEVKWLCTRCHADRHKYLKDNNIII